MEAVVLPPTTLDIQNLYNRNNHHLQWRAADYAGSVLLSSLRNLAERQDILPLDTHNILHRTYQPPEMPTLQQAMQRIEDAYEGNEKLRLGSANNPQFMDFSRDRFIRCLGEYTLLRRVA
jgi:hypothetical protein